MARLETVEQQLETAHVTQEQLEQRLMQEVTSQERLIAQRDEAVAERDALAGKTAALEEHLVAATRERDEKQRRVTELGVPAGCRSRGVGRTAARDCDARRNGHPVEYRPGGSRSPRRPARLQSKHHASPSWKRKLARERDSAGEQMEQVRQQAAEQATRVAQLEAELARERDSAGEQMEQVRQQAAEQATRVAQLEAELARERDSAGEQMEQARQQAAEQATRVAQLEAELARERDSAGEQVEQARQQAAEQATRVTQLEAELARERDSVGERIEQARQQAADLPSPRQAEQLQYLESTLGQQEATIGRLNSEKESALGRLYDAVAQRDKLESKFREDLATATRAEAERMGVMQDRIAQLEREAADLVSRLQDAQRHVEDAQRSSVEREATLAEISNEVADLREQVATHASEEAQAREELAAMRGRLTLAEQDGPRRRELEQSIEKMEGDRRELVEQLQSALQRAAGLEAHLRESDAQLSQAEADRELLAERNQQLADMQQRLAAAEDRDRQREASLRHHEAELSQAETRANEAAQRVRALENSLAQALADQGKLQQGLTDSQTELTRLQGMDTELQRWKDLAQSASGERDDVSRRFQDLQVKQQETETLLRETREALTRTQDESKSARLAALQQVEEQVQRLSSERDTAIRAWGAAEQRASDLQSQLREMESTLQRLELEQSRTSRRLDAWQPESGWSDAVPADEPYWDSRESAATSAEWQQVRHELSQSQRENERLLHELEAAQAEHRRSLRGDRPQGLRQNELESELALARRRILEMEAERLRPAATVRQETPAPRPDAEDTIAQLRSALHDQEAQVVRLEREARQRQDEIEREREQRRSLADRLRQQESSAAASASHADADLESLQAERQQVLDAVRAAEQRIALLETSLSRSDQDREDMRLALEEALAQTTAGSAKKAAKKTTAKKAPKKSTKKK